MICGKCFQSIDSGVCPNCGYDGIANREKYPMALPIGTILSGRYILGHVLGQGGFGITYMAQDYQTKKIVAVKEYFPDFMATRTQSKSVSPHTGPREEHFLYGKQCFLEEAKTLAKFIGNPNIVRIYSYFEENNTAYFVMEYIQGVNFQEFITQSGGKISWNDTKRILLPIMEALEQVHRHGIIHRDVAPDNIMISDDGTVKLFDFGAARVSLGEKSQSLDVILKHGFAPKEQYMRHGRQGPYTDIYSLGATMYYAITGDVPPESISRDEEKLIPPSKLGICIPNTEEKALLKALEVKASDRFQTMEEFRNCLPIVKKPPEKPKPPIDPPPPPPWKKWIILTAAVLAICIISIAIFNQSSSQRDSSSKTTTASAAPSEKTEQVVTPTKAPTEPPKPTERPKPTKPPCSIHSWPETSTGSTIACTKCGATAKRIENIPLKDGTPGQKTKKLHILRNSEGQVKGDIYELDEVINVVKMGITIEFNDIVSGNPAVTWRLIETWPSWDWSEDIQYQSTGSIQLECSFEEPEECKAFFLLPLGEVEGYYSITVDYAYILE